MLCALRVDRATQAIEASFDELRVRIHNQIINPQKLWSRTKTIAVSLIGGVGGRGECETMSSDAVRRVTYKRQQL